jgi:hypothetical protein
MGLLDTSDWHACWIGTTGAAGESMLLRREFEVKAKPKLAVVHVCGLGHYEMTINGKRVGNDILAPGWTKYDKTCLYDTYDIAPLLQNGRNVACLLLGNGMYNVKGGRYTKFTGSFGPLKAIAQMRLEFADGTVETIGTDSKWQASPGPITFSCVYGGEDYDARIGPDWQAAAVVAGPGGMLKGLSCAAPPVRAFDVLQPVAVKQLKPGVAVYDLGRNASMMPRITVKGKPGATVRLIPAELVHPDGSVDRGSCGGGMAYWQYTCAGTGRERYFPKFFYNGCRYLQIECKDAEVARLEGVVVHSAATPVGEFACSNDLFNRIHTLIRWAQRSNMMSVLTDCPHREKLGWLEQDHLNGPSLRYGFDMVNLFAKAMNDMADSQLANGLAPDIAPEYTVFGDGFRDSPEWGSAFVIVPWQQYEWSGDTELLRLHYDGMKRYVAYLGSRSKEHIVSHGLGDWYDLGPNPPGYAQLTPVALTATAFYYYDAWILAEAAKVLGYEDDTRTYSDLASNIRAAFNKAFYKPDTGQYATGSQCANALPLVMGLVEPTNRPAVLEAIVKDVQSRGNGLTAGDVGYRYLLRALADGGRSDVIFDMNNQSDKPGYGFQLKQGATSLTEAWNAGRGSSQNHFMLGHLMEWFYHDLAGIGCDPSGPGFKKIIIKPAIVGDLTWLKAHYDSVYGRIVSNWKREGDKLTMDVTIPPSTTATVCVPAKDAADVTEGGKPAAQAEGVKFLRLENGTAVFEVGAGRYRFNSDKGGKKP